jgi:undecaprenyl-diphosphatase
MELLKWIESIRMPFLDTVFSLVTRLGEEILLIVIFCLIFWCINKKIGYIIGAVFFLSALFVQGLKIVFRIPRPWITDPTLTTVGYSTTEATGYSFPSGHTQTAAAYLTPLGVVSKQKWVKVILFTLVVLVAFSRMYLGVHTLSDVVVSLLITFVITFLAVRFFSEDKDCKKRDILLSVFIGLSAVVVIIYVAFLYHNNITEAFKLRDSVLAAGSALGFAVGMFIERRYIRFSVKAQNIYMQVLKYVLGVGGLLGVREGARVIGSGLVADGIRYFLIVIWVMVVFPLIIKWLFTGTSSDKN